MYIVIMGFKILEVFETREEAFRFCTETYDKFYGTFPDHLSFVEIRYVSKWHSCFKKGNNLSYRTFCDRTQPVGY